MPNVQESYAHDDEFVELVAHWDSISLDFQYASHPDEITLDRYVYGALLFAEDPILESDNQVGAWLEGQHGWSASAISLHVISCSSCRSNVNALRERYERENVHKRVGWWQQIQKDPRRIWSFGTLRRSVLAVSAAVLLFGGGLFVISDAIQNTGDSGELTTPVMAEGGTSIPDDDTGQLARLF